MVCIDGGIQFSFVWAFYPFGFFSLQTWCKHVIFPMGRLILYEKNGCLSQLPMHLCLSSVPAIFSRIYLLEGWCIYLHPHFRWVQRFDPTGDNPKNTDEMQRKIWAFWLPLLIKTMATFPKSSNLPLTVVSKKTQNHVFFCELPSLKLT